LKATKAATAPRTSASEEATRWPLLVLGTPVAVEVEDAEVVAVKDDLEVEAWLDVDMVVELVRGVMVLEVRLAEEVVDLVSEEVDEDCVEEAVEEAVELVAEAVPVPW